MILPLAIACVSLGLINVIAQITMGMLHKTIDLQKRTIAAQASTIGHWQRIAEMRQWQLEGANPYLPEGLRVPERTIN